MSFDKNHRSRLLPVLLLICMGMLLVPRSFSQQPKPAIQGTVLDDSHHAVHDADVLLEPKDSSDRAVVKTDADGVFSFPSLHPGIYRLHAEKAGISSAAITLTIPSVESARAVELVLPKNQTAPADAQAMQFSDKTDFTVAGITDWTAVGGHGSDATLRTSEALTRETATLKAENPGRSITAPSINANDIRELESHLRAALAAHPKSFDANRRLGQFYLQKGRYEEAVEFLLAAYQINPDDYENEHRLALAYKASHNFLESRKHVAKLLASQPDNADLHQLMGDVSENLNDPLTSVNEYQQATHLAPTEQNYFYWGSELLLHRAVWQAQEVFRQGVEAWPESSRLRMALGTAFFAGALYDQAAVSICKASDLNPSDFAPYAFLHDIESAAPAPLPCVEEKLARFVQQQPENASANYFYAMALWKRRTPATDSSHIEALLQKAVKLDAKCGDAYLQLGILSFEKHAWQKAAALFQQAIEAKPELSEAYFRLGVVYDRLGEPAKAKEQFRLHEEIEKSQATAIEKHRQEVKQFQIMQPNQTNE